MRRDHEAQEAIARLETSRAKERVRLASRPTDNWLTVDRYRMEAAAPDAPSPTPEKRGRGRPPKAKVG